MGSTLGSILANLGQEILSVVSAPRGLDVAVGIPTLFDELDAGSVQPGDIVLGLGVAARPREAVGFIEEAGVSGAAAVVLKLAGDPAPELLDSSARTGVALLAAPPAVAWGHLYTLLRVAGGAAMPAGALVDGVPMGDLFALANAIATMVGGAVTIEDPQSYVLAYSSADLPIDEARREVILGRRVPERFLRRLRDAGVFQRLQTTDDVVSYVDREEEILPRHAAGIRAGGELLGSIWVAESPAETLGADAKSALQEAARMAALHMIRHRSSGGLERRQRGELMRGLLEGDVRPDAAARLGLDADSAVTVVALRISASHDPARATADTVAQTERVVGLVALYFESFQRHVAQVTIAHTIYVMVPETRHGERARLLKLIGDLIERARSTVHTRVESGIGSTVASVAEASWSRREADLALRVLAGHPDRSVAPIEAVRAETIVLALRDHALGDAYLRSGPVETLRLHDEQKGTSYIETLSAFFNAFGNVPVAAREIFVHPNTFRYRLRRLTEISGLDLDDPLDRLVAEVQLRVFFADTVTNGKGAATRGSTRARRTRTPEFGGSHEVRARTAEGE